MGKSLVSPKWMETVMKSQLPNSATPLTHQSIDAAIYRARMERAAAMHEVFSHFPALFRRLGARFRPVKQSAGWRAI
jgi:hypothetical protein